MQSGDLVLFRGCGFTSRMIRWWTGSEWSHVGVLWVVLGVPLVIETRLGLGVSVSSLRSRQRDIPTVLPSHRHLDLDLALHHLGSWWEGDEPGVGEYADHLGYECAELAATLLGCQERAGGWTPQSLHEMVTRQAR